MPLAAALIRLEQPASNQDPRRLIALLNEIAGRPVSRNLRKSKFYGDFPMTAICSRNSRMRSSQ